MSAAPSTVGWINSFLLVGILVVKKRKFAISLPFFFAFFLPPYASLLL
jgi:hypothetical protein